MYLEPPAQTMDKCAQFPNGSLLHGEFLEAARLLKTGQAAAARSLATTQLNERRLTTEAQAFVWTVTLLTRPPAPEREAARQTLDGLWDHLAEPVQSIADLVLLLDWYDRALCDSTPGSQLASSLTSLCRALRNCDGGPWVSLLEHLIEQLPDACAAAREDIHALIREARQRAPLEIRTLGRSEVRLNGRILPLAGLPLVLLTRLATEPLTVPDASELLGDEYGLAERMSQIAAAVEVLNTTAGRALVHTRSEGNSAWEYQLDRSLPSHLDLKALREAYRQGDAARIEALDMGPFLPGEVSPWVDHVRLELQSLRDRRRDAGRAPAIRRRLSPARKTGSALHLSTLGQPQLILQQRVLCSPDIISILAYLHLTPSRRATLDELVSACGPHGGGHRTTKPRQALSRARHALARTAQDLLGDALVIADRKTGTWRLSDLGNWQVDATDLLTTHDPDRIVDLYRGGFLPQVDSPWAEEMREHLKRHAARVLASTVNHTAAPDALRYLDVAARISGEASMVQALRDLARQHQLKDYQMRAEVYESALKLGQDLFSVPAVAVTHSSMTHD